MCDRELAIVKAIQELGFVCPNTSSWSWYGNTMSIHPVFRIASCESPALNNLKFLWGGHLARPVKKAE
jgi:hypothetical protein